jgi:carboxypeptidase Taq
VTSAGLPYERQKVEAAIAEVLELVGYPKGRFRIDVWPWDQWVS